MCDVLKTEIHLSDNSSNANSSDTTSTPVVEKAETEISISELASMMFGIAEKNKITVREKIKLLSDAAILPTKGSIYSACSDLFSPIDTVIPPNSIICIQTNIALAWDKEEYYVQLLSRSGLAKNKGVVTEAGVIDYDYRRDIGVLLRNHTNESVEIKRGDRICQYCYLQKAFVNTEVVSEFEPIQTNRTGGFGSTGF